MNTLRVSSLGGLLSVSLVSALIPLTALAAEFRTGEQPSLSSGEAVTNDLYMAGGSVSSAGEVVGDLTVAGGNILINGPVSADVLVGGGSITVLGDVTGDVRFGGGTVVVQGAVAGDVIGGGGQVTLSGSKIGGDVAVGGEQISIDVPISGIVHIGGGNVRINAPIVGNVFVKAQKLTLGPKALLNGSLTYSAMEKATMENGAVVKGGTKFTQTKDVRGVSKAGLAAFFSLWLLAKLLMSLVGAFLIGLLMRRFSRELVATAAMQPLLEIGRGAVVIIVLPVASVVFLFTVIGIPFGFLGIFSFVALMIFTSLISPIVTGSIIHKWIWKPAGYVVDWKTVLLGVAIYFVLGLVPFVGWIVRCGIMLLTLGAVVHIKWSIIKEWK